MEHIGSLFHLNQNFSFWTDQISEQINICQIAQVILIYRIL